MRKQRRKPRRRIQWWQIIGFLLCMYYLAPSFSNMGRLLLHSVAEPVLQLLSDEDSEAALSLAGTQDVGKGNIRFVHVQDDKYSVDGFDGCQLPCLRSENSSENAADS